MVEIDALFDFVTDWAAPVLLVAATLSTIVLLVMWDGRFDLLVVEKGALDVLINVAIMGDVMFW